MTPPVAPPSRPRTARLQDFAPGEGQSAGAAEVGHDDRAWLQVTVPGDVHSALIDAGRIPHPFFDRNELRVRWVEDREWWYRLDVAAPPAPAERRRVLLRFEGLDTFATVWCNGVELGSSANMFREAVFDVTGHLAYGRPNVVAVRFDPALAHVTGAVSPWGRNPERTVMRKAQFGYGWDWGPRLPTIGIWRPVELTVQEPTRIDGVGCATLDLTADRTRALVSVRVEATVEDDRDVELEAVLRRGSDGLIVARAREPLRPDAGGRLDVTCYLTVDDPALWWTHDLGTPTLHDLHVALLDAADGSTLHRSVSRVGLRTLVLDQSPDPDERGTRFFRFLLNGVPIFARGANWIPADSFVATVTEERYASLVRDARDANMTMLRVWGGGIYEHDAFYDACDELGLLVWQDFMFACAAYPEDDGFAAEVEAEARYQVRRLRTHPCLALWCGSNEVQWLHEKEYWDDPAPPPCGERYFDDVLPRVVAELDGRTPYWPGSPYGGSDDAAMNEGNRHNWEAWHGWSVRSFGERPVRDTGPEGVSYRRYAEDTGRFITEFGLHAAPVLETLRRSVPADQLFHHSEAMDHHNKDDPKDKGDNLMAPVTDLPSDLQEYVDFSQLTQAEGLKFAVEHYRRRRPHCSGALVWQLNDCWPAQSWSVIDYHGFAKAGYFALRRAFAPVLASFAEQDGDVELWLTNDTREAVDDVLLVALRTFDGETLASERLTVTLRPLSSQRLWRRPSNWPTGGGGRYLSVRSHAGRIPGNRHFFAAIKDLRRGPTEPGIEMDVLSPGEPLRMTLSAPASAYVLFAHLTTTSASTRYSDNYLDLEPGEQRTIEVTDDHAPLTAGSVQVRWR